MLKQRVGDRPLIYFDSAATALKPQAVIDAISNFYTSEYATVHRSVYHFATQATARYSQVREKVQRFLNAASSDEILFTRGTTEAINLVANSFTKAFLNPGDEILISQMEHHSNIVPWQLVSEERGFHLKSIPINEKGELLLEEFEKLLTPKTKLVAITHISNAIGTRNPIEEMIAIAHRKGAKVLIDGAQSAAHLQIDVQALDADFFAFSGHKAFGPTGIGVLYGKRELLEKMPPYQGGGDMIERVTLEKTHFQPPPLRFEAGTPSIAEVIGLGEALDYIERLGRSKIAEWEDSLLSYATEALLRIEGIRIIGTAKEKGPIISFIAEGAHPLDIGTLLDLRGIAVRTGHHCAQPLMQRFNISGTTRLSFAPYNSFEEIDHFIETLEEVVSICAHQISNSKPKKQH